MFVLFEIFSKGKGLHVIITIVILCIYILCSCDRCASHQLGHGLAVSVKIQHGQVDQEFDLISGSPFWGDQILKRFFYPPS